MPNPVPASITRDVLLGVALTSLLFLISIGMPVLGFISAIFMPLPVLFYRAKLGRQAGTAVPVLAGVVILVILGKPSFDLMFFLELLWLGYVISELYERNLSVELTVLLAGATVLATAVLGLMVYAGSAHQGVPALVTDYVARNLELTLALCKQMEMPKESLEAIARALPRIQYYMVRIIPAQVAVGTLLVTWTNILVSRPMLRSRGLAEPAFGELKRWRSPEPLVWALIACAAATLMPGQLLMIIGLNGLLVVSVIYLFHGLAIVAYFLQKKQIPPALRVMIYGMIAIQQMLLLAVVGLGIFDMWLDFRKLRQTTGSAPPDGNDSSGGV